MLCRQLRLARWHRAAEKRPRRTNFWAQEETAAGPVSHKYDPNQFGTNEFVHFCKLIGSQPYLAANVRSLPADEFYRWVEYCNSPAGSTTLADMRAAGGISRNRSAFATGASATSRGAAAAISRRRNMPWNSADTPPGCRSMDKSCPSSPPVPM